MKLVFFILAFIVLGGLAVAGYNVRKKGAAVKVSTQTTYPSISASPTGAAQVPTETSGYQAGMPLVINSPASGLEVATPNVTIIGTTAPNAEVFVNDISGKADMNGYFSISVSIEEGTNTIIVTANDANGNSAEQEVTVSYNPGT